MKLEEEISQKSFRNDYHKAAVNLIYTYNWLSAFHHATFKASGITMQQFNILRILRGQHPQPCTIKEIKERMLDKMSDASRLVEKLRTKGLAKRNVKDEDRRNVNVLITEKGLNLLTVLDKKMNTADEFMNGLSVDEVAQLNFLLDKLRG